MTRILRLDEIGPWSELKLNIIKEYAIAYSTILNAQKIPFHHVYIDAFAGAGFHFSKDSGQLIEGSPTNALLVEPPFKEYHFIDKDAAKVEFLKKRTEGRRDVHIHEGDCNKLLLQKVFPRIEYSSYRRGLCVLDPYGLHLDWKVILEAGRKGTIDIFLNFPILDIQRNILRARLDQVEEVHRKRMTLFWGDESWTQIAFEPIPNFFYDEEARVISGEQLAEEFRNRLLKEAGFKNAPPPILMRNRKNAPLYYLFFASNKDVATKIVKSIESKYLSA